MSNALWLFFVYKRCPPTCQMEYILFPTLIFCPPLRTSRNSSLYHHNELQTCSLSTSIIVSNISLQELQEFTFMHTSTWRDTYSQLDACSLNDTYRLLIHAYSHALTLSASSIISLFLFIPSFLPPPYFGRWLVSVPCCWTFVLPQWWLRQGTGIPIYLLSKYQKLFWYIFYHCPHTEHSVLGCI